MEPALPTPYITPIAFDEADGEGIVFFGNYFRLAHRALEQFLPQTGIAWRDWFQNPEVAIPLRHVEADYAAPLRPGEVLQIVVEVSQLRENSVEFTYRMFSEKNTEREIAIARTVHVFVDRKTFTKIAIPPVIRDCLASR